MSDDHSSAEAAGALGSVRQLEAALEATSTAREAAEAQLAAARAEASRLLAAAADDAAAAAAERRRSVLAAADADAAAIRREAEGRVEQLRVNATASRETAVETALALLLPAGTESEA